MKRIDMIDELGKMVAISRAGLSPLTDNQKQALEMAHKILVDPVNVVCGACANFTNETTDGSGLCFDKTPTLCYGSHALFCCDFEFRTNSED